MCEISIIMPVYNKENYVHKAIRSILDQTFRDWELLIIDDGSTDKSLRICRNFSDARIQIISVKNGGVSSARNIGLSKAKGTFVTFIDSDDYVGTDYLEKLYHPQYDFVIAGLKKVDKDGKMIQEVKPRLQGGFSIETVAKTFYGEQMSSGIYGFVASKLIRREVIEKNMLIFDSEIKLAEDYDFFLSVYEKINRIYFAENAEYYYVQETDNSGILLDDSKTDFFQQMQIQIKTKNFLEIYDGFGEKEKALYLERMTGYVYTLFLLQKQTDRKSVKELSLRLKQLVPEVSKTCRGSQKLLIDLYRKDCYLGISVFLKLRQLIRRTA